eukprot:1477317-Rhodomonas_salina.4
MVIAKHATSVPGILQQEYSKIPAYASYVPGIPYHRALGKYFGSFSSTEAPLPYRRPPSGTGVRELSTDGHRSERVGPYTRSVLHVPYRARRPIRVGPYLVCDVDDGKHSCGRKLNGSNQPQYHDPGGNRRAGAKGSEISRQAESIGPSVSRLGRLGRLGG